MTDATQETYADRVIQEAMVAATGGLDAEAGTKALDAAIRALAKQMEALEAATYDPAKVADNARAAAHTMKAADELYRLLQFAKGQPDSRPELGAEWLRGLTDEQLRIVQGWMEGKAPHA